MGDKIDYEPSKWGPSAWSFLHTVSFSYPEEPDEATRQEYRDFFLSLRHVLPCSKCRDHYSRSIMEVANLEGSQSDPFRSRDALCHWLVGLHNEVNKRTHKKEVVYEEVFNTYNEKTMLCSAPSLIQTNGRRPSRRSRPLTPSMIALIIFVVVVLLFIAACVVAYTGCSCVSRSGQKKCFAK